MQRDATQPLYLDIHLAPGARFEQPLPAGHNGFTYTYRGTVHVGPEGEAAEVPSLRMAVLANAGEGEGSVLLVNTSADTPARTLLIAGQPLNEPIAQYGPFVMNTQEEVFQAVADFRAGRLA
jgi:redox-sensitive bicupin YhaK (pirin superfamily)